MNNIVPHLNKNAKKIAALIMAHKELTRTQLCDMTGLTGAAVSRITRDMIDTGLLVEGGEIVNAKRAGRREVILRIRAEHAHVLGMTITGNRRNLILATAAGDILEEIDMIEVSLSNPDEALKCFCDALKDCVDRHGLSLSDIAGVGVSMSITATSSTELVTASPLGWKNVNVREILEAELSVPVVIEARATSILRADLLDQHNYASAFLINVALGVGSSAYVNQELITPGSTGFGGLTHLAVHGDPSHCYCGRTGCLEVSGGGHAILAHLGLGECSTKTQNERLSVILDQAYGGDRAACDAIRHAARNMAIGIDHTISLFAPETVILTGIVGRHDIYRMAVIERLHELGQRVDARIIRPSLIRSSDATVWLALERLVAHGLVSTVMHNLRSA